MLLANVCKQNVTRFPYEIARLAEDIAGGLMVTMPSGEGPAGQPSATRRRSTAWCALSKKYFQGGAGSAQRAAPPRSSACASCA
jgi:aromatic ring hydroxylase